MLEANGAAMMYFGIICHYKSSGGIPCGCPESENDTPDTRKGYSYINQTIYSSVCFSHFSREILVGLFCISSWVKDCSNKYRQSK